MSIFPHKLVEKRILREKESTLRELSQKNNLIDFSSNDYLGFATNETIYSNTFQLMLKQGNFQNGATGSRLLTGNHVFYVQLEALLAKVHLSESALVFNSGYDANIGFFEAVPQRGDLIFYDEYIHASIRDGIRMSAAKGYKFTHNNLEDLQSKISRILQQQTTTLVPEVYIVTESVFSMDGDTPDLTALVQFCIANGYRLVVDEAHALGVFHAKGWGLLQELGIQDHVFARIITFGKALGCHGAAILGSNQLSTYLINFARSFIYTTALTPHTIATILSAYEYLSSVGIKEQQQLKNNIQTFKERMLKLQLQDHFIPSDSAIQSCVLSGNEKVKKVSRKLADKGFDIKAIVSPTVPEGKERLRFCIHSYHSKEELELALELLKTMI